MHAGRLLPGAVLQCLPGNLPGRVRNRPGAKFFTQGVADAGSGKKKPDPRPRQPEKLAERTQDDQSRQVFAVRQFGERIFRFGIGKGFVDDQPAAAPLQGIGGGEQVGTRDSPCRRIVRIAQQDNRRCRRQRPLQRRQTAQGMAAALPGVRVFFIQRRNAGDRGALEEQRQGLNRRL